MLTFPVRPGPTLNGIVLAPGLPERAQPCHCIRGPFLIVDHDTCLRCGHHPAEVVSLTWAERARQVARQRTKRRAA